MASAETDPPAAGRNAKTSDHLGVEPGLDAASPQLQLSIARRLNEGFATLLALRSTQTGKAAWRASAWSAASYGGQTLMRFISRLVLAKLLSNAAPMGDVAIIVVILAGLEMISDLGIGFGIVQHARAGEQAYLGTAFSVQAIRGVAIWAIASALAAPVAWIYHAPALMGLLLFGALSTLFRAFANPGVWLHTRHLTLRAPTILSIASEAAGFVVTVGWTILAPSAWAIVGGTVATAAAYTLGSHFVGGRSRFAWNREVAREIIQFGGWMVLSSGTYFLSSRGESLMLRGSVPDIEFGCFAFATMLVTTPSAAITQLASQVFFPMLASSVRDGGKNADRQFRMGKWGFTALALLLVWGSVFVAPPAIALMRLKPSFAGLAWMVPLLGVRAALDIFVSPTGSLLFASGASRYSAWANVVRLSVLVGGLFLTIERWGLHGAIWVLVGAPAISYLTLLPGVRRYLPSGLRTELAALLVFWGGSVAALGLHLILFG
jgi:O-antigen/teichoic acid export membrane protein